MFAFVICILLAWIVAAAIFGTWVGLGVAIVVMIGLGWKAATSDWFV
jgi:hypothetical protein